MKCFACLFHVGSVRLKTSACRSLCIPPEAYREPAGKLKAWAQSCACDLASPTLTDCLFTSADADAVHAGLIR